jgi:hypothetical protein
MSCVGALTRRLAAPSEHGHASLDAVEQMVLAANDRQGPRGAVERVRRKSWIVERAGAVLLAEQPQRERDVIGGQNVAIMKLDAVSNLEFTREIVDLLPGCRQQRLELERSAVGIDQRVIDPKAQEKAFAPGRIISIRLCGAWRNAEWIVSSEFPAKLGIPEQPTATARRRIEQAVSSSSPGYVPIGSGQPLKERGL